MIAWPEGRRPSEAAREWLGPVLKSDGALRAEPTKVAGLLKAWAAAPAHVRRQVRVSQHLAPWFERQSRLRLREKARAIFLREEAAGEASFDLTRLPLLPYQRDGMLHLAFGERALLADEMGLGKTVQAIAAAELLARRRGVTRVLVLCPASLKSEWEEQIVRFTERPARSVFGPRKARLAAYREPAFSNIARAWRKGQMRSVTVVNLVAEDSIEHGMVHLLGAKQALADGVLDGQGDLAALKMPSGRAAMIERMAALMQTGSRSTGVMATPPEEAVAEDLKRRHGERALLIEARKAPDGEVNVLAVLDADQAALAAEATRLAPPGDGATPSVEVIDHATWNLLQRLHAKGVIQFAGTAPRSLHQSAALAEDPAARRAAVRAAELRSQAERQLRKAQVLAAGGFPEEICPLISVSIGHAAAARLALLGELAAGTASATTAQVRDLVARGVLPAQAADMVDSLAATTAQSDEGLERLLAAAADIVSECTLNAEELLRATSAVLPARQVG